MIGERSEWTHDQYLHLMYYKSETTRYICFVLRPAEILSEVEFTVWMESCSIQCRQRGEPWPRTELQRFLHILHVTCGCWPLHTSCIYNSPWMESWRKREWEWVSCNRSVVVMCDVIVVTLFEAVCDWWTYLSRLLTQGVPFWVWTQRTVLWVSCVSMMCSVVFCGVLYLLPSPPPPLPLLHSTAMWYRIIGWISKLLRPSDGL